jgi:hypothetical protein
MDRDDRLGLRAWGAWVDRDAVHLGVADRPVQCLEAGHDCRRWAWADAQEWLGALLLPDVLPKVVSQEPGQAVAPGLVVEREIRCWAGARGCRRKASEPRFRLERNLALEDEQP